MSESRLAAVPAKDQLNRKQLERQFARSEPVFPLLERLCVDSVYTLSDEFDDGLSPNKWVTENLFWNDSNDDGSLQSDSNDDDPFSQGILLMSRLPSFRFDRRPVMQVRIDFSPASQLAHFEVGFVSSQPGQGAVTNITSSATSRDIGVQTFGVAVRDSSFDTSDAFYIVSGGANPSSASSQVASTTVSPNPALSGSMTLTVAGNEQGEVRLWINGQHDNSFVRESDIIPALGCHLWVYGQNGAYSIDYIQAWRERQVL